MRKQGGTQLLEKAVQAAIYEKALMKYAGSVPLKLSWMRNAITESENSLSFTA